MPKLTLHLDDESYRLAKIHAATHRTSLSHVFRERIRALTAEDGAGKARLLERCSRSEISATEAMDALGLTCVEDLFSVIRTRNLPMPRMSGEAAGTLAEPVLSLLSHPVKRGARRRA